MEQKLNFPTEQIELPSKGLTYPKESPLSKGVLEMKYMSAKEEDILTNINFLKQGIVIDKLLQSLIITPIDYNDILIGDKNALSQTILGSGNNALRVQVYDYEIKELEIREKESRAGLFSSHRGKEFDVKVVSVRKTVPPTTFQPEAAISLGPDRGPGPVSAGP